MYYTCIISINFYVVIHVEMWWYMYYIPDVDIILSQSTGGKKKTIGPLVRMRSTEWYIIA